MNLAVALRKQRSKESDKDRLQKSLATFETKLGVAHPNVATAKHWLGAWYDDLDMYGEEKAEKFYTEALRIRETVLTENHLDIAKSHDALAALYRDQQKSEAAEKHEKKARAIRQKNIDDKNLMSGN